SRHLTLLLFFIFSYQHSHTLKFAQASFSSLKKKRIGFSVSLITSKSSPIILRKCTSPSSLAINESSLVAIVISWPSFEENFPIKRCLFSSDTTSSSGSLLRFVSRGKPSTVFTASSQISPAVAPDTFVRTATQISFLGKNPKFEATPG